MAGRPSSWLVVREAVSRWQVAHRRAVMVAKPRRRCPQEHGPVAQRAPAGHGGPRGADAGRAFVSVSVSSASVRSPVSGAGVQHHACLSTRLSGVRCGRLSVQMSGVRCPAWVSGVRGFPRPLYPAGRLWRGAVGRQPHGWDGRRRRGRLPCPRPVRRLPGSEPGGRGWPRPCWSAEGSAWTWPSSWAVVGQRLGRPRGRPGLAGWARGSPVGGESGCAARWRLRCVVIVCGPGPGRLVAASLLGWTATCACGRGAAAARSERRRLDAGDALTCNVGGGGEGI